MHLARLNNRPPSCPLRSLRPMQRSLIALIPILARCIPMYISLFIRPKQLPRLMHRDNVRVVRSLRSAEVVKRVAGWVMLFKVPRPIARASSAAGCKGAGFFKESDEERFYGWEARGYDADVHFDDLPDVYQVSFLVIADCKISQIWGEVENGLQYHEPSPVKSCTSKKWYCIGVL